MAQAGVTFGTLNKIKGMVFTLSRGVTPSVFTIYMKPQDNLDEGVQTLTYGTGNNLLSLSGCVLSQAFVRKNYDRKAPIWAVTGLDRRWQWKFCTISGDYNRRKPDGTLDTSTQKTPAELATLIGGALFETIDVSRMPSGVFPRVQWKNQRADLALQALCDYVACEVILNPVNNKVEIWPLGSGQSIQTGLTEIRPQYRFFPRSDIPSRVEVHGGDSLYQHKLQLRTVLRNQNGDQKLITNWEGLAYAAVPTESPWSFQDISTTANRENAYEGYFREFRVTGQSDGSTQVPGCPIAVTKIDQYLLNDFTLSNEKDLEGYYRPLPYYLSGDYYAYTDLPNNTSNARFTGDSRLYPERRIIKTDYPVFKLDASGKYSEPAFYLNTSYRVRDSAGQVVHIVRSGNVGGSGGALILRRPELYATYTSTTNTEAQANTEADAYVQIFSQKYASPQASEITYAGMYGGSTDGRVAQIRWDILPTLGVRTSVYENYEGDVFAVSANERRRRLDIDRYREGQ